MNTISNSKNSNSIHIPPGGDPRKNQVNTTSTILLFFSKNLMFLDHLPDCKARAGVHILLCMKSCSHAALEGFWS